MVYAVHTSKKYLPPDYSVDLDGQFKPGILNTCVFLVSSVQQVTVFFVNLQGRPFMTGVSENRPLLWSLVSTFILTFMFASETVPGLNRYFQLVPFPDEAFRNFILGILTMDLGATFVLDRLMKFFFARDILRASFEETSLKDVFGLIRTFVMVGVLMYYLLGSSEQWDILLEMQNNATMNATDGVDGGMVASTVEECFGSACEALHAAVDVARDEF
jgi:manganese-transporting P-type ATPase